MQSCPGRGSRISMLEFQDMGPPTLSTYVIAYDVTTT